MSGSRENEPATPSPGCGAPGGTAGDSAEYLAFVIHEARNPLASALWSAQMLERLSPEERVGDRPVKLAARVGRALGRLSRLLEDHFLAERLRAGGFPLHREPVDLLRCLEEQASRASVPVDLDRGAAGALIEADRALLARAIDCLLAASGRDVARVTVATRARDHGVSVRFAGARVEPAALERPRRGAVSDPSGHALGLVVAGEVARAHGGSLAVDGGILQLDWPRVAP